MGTANEAGCGQPQEASQVTRAEEIAANSTRFRCWNYGRSRSDRLWSGLGRCRFRRRWCSIAAPASPRWQPAARANLPTSKRIRLLGVSLFAGTASTGRGTTAAAGPLDCQHSLSSRD
jgi:hypothetical protein